jgi:hypothetical protein
MTKLLNTVATRIQTRLSRKGLKVALGEVKDHLKANVGNIENITDVEVNATTEYFLSSANQLTVIGENVDNADNADSDIDNVLTLSIQEDVEEEAIAPQTEPAPLVVSPKNELVASTADQMGIVLDASEISLIAENINHSSDDFDQDIDAIKSAIMAFVQHKSLINQSKINQMIHEVREVVSEKNSENSQLLSDGLRSINNDIQEANKQFKSNVQKCLTAFAIPAIKAS